MSGHQARGSDTGHAGRGDDDRGGGTNQHWIPAAAAVMSGIPGKCVDDTGSSTANGTRMQTWSCRGTTLPHSGHSRRGSSCWKG